MKQIHIIYIVCAAAALGAFLLFAPAKNTIVLKDDGFHPRTLTIREGETVTFRSERGKYFWPASDFHPTHKLYPAFDAKRAVSPNDSWSFTFDEAGVYKFHDHLAAYFFGVIKVADAEGNVTDDCMAHGGQFECWQNDIFIALAEKGLGAAYDEVARLYAAEPDFASSCHYIAHNIGHRDVDADIRRHWAAVLRLHRTVAGFASCSASVARFGVSGHGCSQK